MTDRRHRVAVIDDDPSVRGALLRLFRTAALDVSLFATAEEFLAQRDETATGCLVIDVWLPGLGGLELLEQVRAERPQPCLIITAQEDKPGRDRAFAAGAVGYFVKPFDNRQLLATVFQALGDSESA